MTRKQRFQYDMFVRVSGFGAAHKDLFPESSAGNEWFKQVTTLVGAINQYLKDLVVARAEARRVKAGTRSAVVEYMKTIAKVASRAMRNESGEHPFRMPRQRHLSGIISTARAFLAEAAERQEQFARFGLPATAISEFEALVNTLDKAAETRQQSKTARREVKARIEAAIESGLEVIRDLDAAVSVATRQDPARFAAWQLARRVEGQNPPDAAKPDPGADTTSPKETETTPAAEPVTSPTLG